MKKIFVLFFVITLTLSVSSQNYFTPDYKSVGAINAKLDSMARHVIFDFTSHKVLCKKDTVYTDLNLSETMLVFEKNGYRFSMYIQMDIDLDQSLSMMNHHCLTIYYRPIGTQDKKSLRKIVDYHINGSVDEYDNWIVGSNFLGVWGQDEYKKILKVILKQ